MSQPNPHAEIFKALFAEFPQTSVGWRAQTVTGDGQSALALAYIDARDVMNRLDKVIGPENWSDSYHETAKGRIICNISLKIGGEWISKSDGAGETDVEAEKGAISDAFKRAAVKWGIGRYLYNLPTPWVPCEAYKGRDDKWKWKHFKDDPWKYVNMQRSAA